MITLHWSILLAIICGSALFGFCAMSFFVAAKDD
jgi:hypothetical protein